jgi:hypothetical protein
MQGLFSLTQDELVRKGSAGTHKNEIFQGHCLGEGGENYLNINATEESFHQAPKLYKSKTNHATIARNRKRLY